MILARYTQFRARFATSSTLAVDGLPEWPTARTGIGNGWVTADVNGKPVGTISKPARPYAFTDGAPVSITCNGGLDDGDAGTTYDWYLSQRTDDPAGQCWRLVDAPSDANSGQVKLSLVEATARTLVPTGDLFAPDALAILAAACHLYVQRRSDMAIQFVRFISDPNAFDTGLWDPVNQGEATLLSTGLFATVGA